MRPQTELKKIETEINKLEKAIVNKNINTDFMCSLIADLRKINQDNNSRFLANYMTKLNRVNIEAKLLLNR